MFQILNIPHRSQRRILPLFLFEKKKNFRGKLSYDQVSDILDSYAIPSVDCLFSPTWDNSVLNEISLFNGLESTHKSVTRNWPLCRGPC